jgi:hypothetical protein
VIYEYKVGYKTVISLFGLFVNIKRLYFHMYQNSTDFSQNMGKNISKSNNFFLVSFQDFQISYRIVSNQNWIISYQFSVLIFQSRPCLAMVTEIICHFERLHSNQKCFGNNLVPSNNLLKPFYCQIWGRYYIILVKAVFTQVWKQ